MCQEYFDENFLNYFDFDENYSGLLKEFWHLSLFSVFLHFLKCIKSCENMWNIPVYCKLCSRVPDHTFVPCNCYGNLLIIFGSSVLDLTTDRLCIKMDNTTYYRRNREKILNRAKDYYENDKERLREQARNKYRNLSEEDKNKKREYGKNRYHNMSEEKKQELKEYQKRRYREAKESRNNE